jgi:hypothetical protein
MNRVKGDGLMTLDDSDIQKLVILVTILRAIEIYFAVTMLLEHLLNYDNFQRLLRWVINGF